MAFQDKLKPIGSTSFQSKLKPIQKHEFRFDVQEAPGERESKIANYQAEAQRSAEESKKANSLLGKTGNFFRSAGEMIANSEVALGRTIGKIIGASDTTLTDAQKLTTDTQVNLLKAIRDKEGRGEDATRLKQEYNRLMNDPSRKEVDSLVKEQFTLPTTGEVVGQIGGTALDVLTAGTYSKFAKTGQLFIQPGSKIAKATVAGGLPELAPLARQQASGMFTKRGAANIAGGAAIGYASDVTQGLQGARGEDREGAKAFIPGLGTALGVGIPAISEGTQSVKNQFTEQGRNTQISQKRGAAFDDLVTKYNRVGKAVDAANRKGVDVRQILTETNVLNGAVDADGTVSVERALQNFDEFVQPYEGKVREAIRREGTKVRIADVASAMDDFAAKSDLNGAAFEQLNSTLLSDLRGLQRKYGDNIPVEALHDTKIFRGSHSNYMDTGANAVNKEATRFFKDVVEKNVRSLDVQQYNAELSKLYAVQDVIESLSRTKVKGARLGKYFASAIGTGIGASSGNPLLAILGAEIGSRTNSAILSRSLGGNITKGMEVPGELTDILARQKTGKDVIPPVEIPRSKPFGELNLQSSSKVGSRNMSQPATMTKTKKAIPNTILPVKDFNNKLSTGEKYRNAKLAAIAELDVELNELSQAGYRYAKPSDVGGGSDFVGVGSTFPKWVPEHLRSKSLFDTVMPMVERETPPPPHASKQLELYNVLQSELQKRVDNPRKEYRAPKGNSEVFAGAAVGFEEDENGNLTFSPEKALVGMVGVAGLTRSQAVNKLSKNLDDTMRRVFTEFVDVVRLKKYKMVNGRMVFDTPEAEKAFDEGIKFVNGAAIKTTENFASKTPAKIADLFDDVVQAADNKPLGKVTPKPKPAPATALLQEAKKYKSAEEFVKAQGTPVYHATDSDVFDPKDFNPKAAAKGEEFFNPLGAGLYASSNKDFVRRFGNNTMELVLPKNAKTKSVSIDSWEKDFDSISRRALKNLGIKYNELTFDEKLKINRLVPNTPIESANNFEVILGDIAERLGKDGIVQDAIQKSVMEQYNSYDVIKYLDTDYAFDADEIVIPDPSILKTRSQLEDIWKQANK